MSEIKLHGVTKLGLKNIIDFIYTSKVSLDMGNLQDTLEAANFLQVMPVLRFCNHLLISEVRLRRCIFSRSSSLICQSPLCLCSRHPLSAADQGPYDLQIHYVDVHRGVFFFPFT